MKMISLICTFLIWRLLWPPAILKLRCTFNPDFNQIRLLFQIVAIEKFDILYWKCIVRISFSNKTKQIYILHTMISSEIIYQIDYSKSNHCAIAKWDLWLVWYEPEMQHGICYWLYGYVKCVSNNICPPHQQERCNLKEILSGYKLLSGLPY